MGWPPSGCAGALSEVLGAWLARLDEATLLNSNRAHEVYRLEDGAGDWVLKRIKPTKSRRRSAIAAFAKGWHLYGQQPGAVPRPVGAIEWYRGATVHSGCLIADYVAGRSLKALLERDACSEALLAELGRFLARLHETGIVLKDAHKENVWVREVPYQGERFALVDLDALAWRRPGYLERTKLLMKLGLPTQAHRVMATAYWEAVGRPPSRTAAWFLEYLYYPVKEIRRALVMRARRR